VRLLNITGTVSRSLTADAGFGLIDLARVARVARGLAGGGLATYTVPATPDNIDGAAVLVPNEEAATLFASFASGGILQVAPPPEGDVRPQDVLVDVLNGAGIEGLAGRARDRLAGAGFQVGNVGNAPEQVERTLVRHPPGLEAQAATVAGQFPGAELEVGTKGTPVTLVLGPDAEAAPAPPPPPAPGQTAGAPAPALGAAPVPPSC
jgi:hypothetical protein